MLNILNTFFLWWGDTSQWVEEENWMKRSVKTSSAFQRKFNFQHFKVAALNFALQAKLLQIPMRI